MLSAKQHWHQTQKCPCCCVPWHLSCPWGRRNSSENVQKGSVQLRQVSLPCFQLWQRFSMYGLRSTNALCNAWNRSATVSEKNEPIVRRLQLILRSELPLGKRTGSSGWWKTAKQCSTIGERLLQGAWTELHNCLRVTWLSPLTVKQNPKRPFSLDRS